MVPSVYEPVFVVVLISEPSRKTFTDDPGVAAAFHASAALLTPFTLDPETVRFQGVTVTGRLTVAVTPPLSVTVSTTVYVPAVAYVRATLDPLPPLPSPRVQVRDAIVPSASELVSVNEHARPEHELVNDADGARLGNPATPTGTELFVVDPFPSCPKSFHPQHLTAPAVVTAHETPKPAEIDEIPDARFVTSTGTREHGTGVNPGGAHTSEPAGTPT